MRTLIGLIEEGVRMLYQILIVDDDPEFRQEMAKALRAESLRAEAEARLKDETERAALLAKLESYRLEAEARQQETAAEPQRLKQ